MQFWYNMYGATIGSLSVSVLVQGSSSPTKVWELSGAQGNQWKNAQVNIVSNKAYQVSSFITRLIDLIHVEMCSMWNSLKIWKFKRFVHWENSHEKTDQTRFITFLKKLFIILLTEYMIAMLVW